MIDNDRIELLQGDCLQLMKDIPAGSIDMILCDLPYGMLSKQNPNTKWDAQLDLQQLWKQYRRIIKKNGCICLFGSGAFTAALIMSNPRMYRYNLVWDKVQKTGFLNANRMPLRQHEDIVVFYKRLPTYNPQMEKCDPTRRNHNKGKLERPTQNNCYANYIELPTIITDEKFPTSIIRIPREHSVGRMFHPTQKPVALLEYLIKTYSNEGETILDNCMGSGSTGIACINTGRRFIGMEIDDWYFEVAEQRIKEKLA